MYWILSLLIVFLVIITSAMLRTTISGITMTISGITMTIIVFFVFTCGIRPIPCSIFLAHTFVIANKSKSIITFVTCTVIYVVSSDFNFSILWSFEFWTFDSYNTIILISCWLINDWLLHTFTGWCNIFPVTSI